MVDDVQTVPWKRRSGEPTLWYRRFEFFRKLGPERSLRGAYRDYIKSERVRKGLDEALPEGHYENPPRQWPKAAEQFNWLERAEAWDVSEIEKENDQFEADRLARRKRLSESFELATENLALKILEAGEKLDVVNPKWNQVISGIKTLHQVLNGPIDQPKVAAPRSGRASGPDDGEDDSDISLTQEAAADELAMFLTQVAVRKNYQPLRAVPEDETLLDSLLDEPTTDSIIQSG